MLGVPALAILASFALPTLQRATSSAIDWFSVFFFCGGALLLWIHYLALQTGFPPKPAANMARLVPGYEPSFSALGLAFGIAGTIAWSWLVYWRTGRNRHPVWKSMVLPAGGVALCWMLATSLLMSPVDYARSHRSLIDRIAVHVPRNDCVASEGVPLSLLAALEYMGPYRVQAQPGAISSGCEFLLRLEDEAILLNAVPARWQRIAQVKRPMDKNELIGIYRRRP
jgi:hypothetical protein